MKLSNQFKKMLSSGVCLLSLSFAVLQAQAAGLLLPVNSTDQAMEISEHHVNVEVEDGFAMTTIDQVFANPNSRDLEAVYSFPVPSHAAVAEFTVWIDGKPITGEVVKNETAERIYKEEKKAGNSTGIAKKNEFKTFEIAVYPVKAKQNTKVRLRYYQTITVDTSVGSYVYPLEDGGVDDQSAFWATNANVKQAFSFNLAIRSAYPIAAVRSPNQPDAAVSEGKDGLWNISMRNSQKSQLATLESTVNNANVQNISVVKALDKDIIIYWRLQDGLPASVDLITYKEKPNSHGTFHLTLTPGDDLAEIKNGKDWIFVLDKSGSMQSKFATLAEAVSLSFKKMRDNDRFAIVAFNSRAEALTSGFVNATIENVDYYTNQLKKVNPSSSTNMFAGIKAGTDLVELSRPTGLILVTDGVTNVGVTAKKAFLDLIRQNDIRLFTFILGNSADQPFLESLTKASGGFSLTVSNDDDIVGKILLAASKLSHESLQDVEIKIDGVRVDNLTPKKIGSIYRGQQVVVSGQYWGNGTASVVYTGKVAGQLWRKESLLVFPETNNRNPELERLWAYAKIEDIEANKEFKDDDETKESDDAIADIAKQYGLVTDQTSMIIARQGVLLANNIIVQNQARLDKEEQARITRTNSPTPKAQTNSGSSSYDRPRASFGGGGSGGSADIWSLMLLSLATVLLIKRRREAKI